MAQPGDAVRVSGPDGASHLLPASLHRHLPALQSAVADLPAGAALPIPNAVFDWLLDLDDACVDAGELDLDAVRRVASTTLDQPGGVPMRSLLRALKMLGGGPLYECLLDVAAARVAAFGRAAEVAAYLGEDG